MKQLLKDFATIGAGQGAPQGDENYSDVGTPFVKAGNLQGLLEGKNINGIQQVSKEVAKKHKLKLYPKGTILFAKSGMSCMKGFVYVLPQGAHVVNHLACITPNEDISEYLKFYFNFHKPNQLVKDTAYPSISLSDIGELEIDMKNDSERKEIINQLQRIESIISLRQQELSNLDNLIKARFVEMFGDPLSNPMGWNKVAIDDCVESIDNGKSFVCDGVARTGEAPAILKLSAATYGVYKPEENKAIIDENDFVENAEVHAGDLLFTRKNTPELVGMAAYVFSTPNKLMMPDLIFRINTKQNCRKIYLWKLINHDLFRSQIQSIAGGSAKSMSNISKERLGKLRICLPSLELQMKYEEFVIQTDKSKFMNKTIKI